MSGCESWIIKKTEWQRIAAFGLWYWRRLLRVPWTAGRSNQSILKEISSEYSLEGLMLKKRSSSDVKNQLTGRDPDAGKDWRQEGKGMTWDEMVGQHHWLNGHKFEQTSGDGKGQRSPKCYRPRGCKESDMVEQLNSKYLFWIWKEVASRKCPVWSHTHSIAPE